MFIAAEHCAIWTDRGLACLTVIIQSSTMFFADFCSFSQQLIVVQSWALVAGLSLIEGIDVLSYFFDKSAATNKLMDLQWATTMRTLLSLFNQPFPHAILAAQLAATGADHRVFNFAEADETFKDVFKILIRWGCRLFLFFSLMLVLMSRNVRFNDPACVSALDGAYISNSMWVSCWASSNSWNDCTDGVTHWAWHHVVIVIDVVLLGIRLVSVSLVCCQTI